GLRAAVEELEVVEEGDSRAWETPKHVVGHIPTTAKPGTSGQGWYFGHLESPISGEGNIFRQLPELAARFKRGEQFTIQLDAGSDRYIYQVYRTDVVHASEFAVSDSGLNDITLVACWPQFEYSERVLVTAALVDIVKIPEPERIQPNSG
ncbi:MAG: sortase, partial [Chloroflexota bacterium]|nr:sortase [Chloroflexota bacterium]